MKRPLHTQIKLREGLVCNKVMNFSKGLRESASHSHQTYWGRSSLSRGCKSNESKSKKKHKYCVTGMLDWHKTVVTVVTQSFEVLRDDTI